MGGVNLMECDLFERKVPDGGGKFSFLYVCCRICLSLSCCIRRCDAAAPCISTHLPYSQGKLKTFCTRYTYLDNHRNEVRKHRSHEYPILILTVLHSHQLLQPLRKPTFNALAQADPKRHYLTVRQRTITYNRRNLQFCNLDPAELPHPLQRIPIPPNPHLQIVLPPLRHVVPPKRRQASSNTKVQPLQPRQLARNEAHGVRPVAAVVLAFIGSGPPGDGDSADRGAGHMRQVGEEGRDGLDVGVEVEGGGAVEQQRGFGVHGAARLQDRGIDPGIVRQRVRQFMRGRPVGVAAGEGAAVELCGCVRGWS